jgi:hypothetical protein
VVWYARRSTREEWKMLKERRTVPLAAANWPTWILALALAASGCGNDSSPKPSESSPPDTNPAGSGRGTVWINTGLWLQGMDLESGEAVTDVFEVTTGLNSLYAMVPDGDRIWLGREDGAVVVVDPEKDEPTVLPVDSEETWGISQLAVGGGLAYVASRVKPHDPDPAGPPLVTIDTETLNEVARRDVFGEEFNEVFSSLALDGATLWGLHENSLGLLEIDADTLAVKRRLPLAENFENPSGPPVEGHGYGYMEQIGDALWVLDYSTNRVPIWRVDKATLTPTRVRELADEFGDLASECVRMASNEDSLFVLFCDDSVATVAHLDGTTGKTRAVYEFDSPGPGILQPTNDTLYVDSPSSPFEVVGVNLKTGAQRVVYTDTNYITGFAIAGAMK